MYLPFYKQARMQHVSLLSENASYVVSFVYVDCLWYERAIVVVKQFDYFLFVKVSWRAFTFIPMLKGFK